MSIADGIRMGMGLINDSQAAKAREEELKAWREEREDKKARNLVLDTNMEQTLAALGKAEDTVSPFLSQQGLAPMSTYYEGQQGAYNRRQGFGAAPDEVTQAEQINLPKRDNTLVMGQLKAMQAARDTAGFYSVANQDKKDRLAHGAAQIQRYVASNATPDQIKAFSEKYTAEARIPGKMKFDPASGMTTIDLDSGESVKLDRQQFGSYLAGLYRQEQGDTTAAADIAGIHKALGEQADKMFSRQTGVVKVNNDVAKDKADIGLKGAHSAYYTKMADVAGQKVDAAAGNLSELDSLALKDIANQRKVINEAIIKAQAEGSFDAKTPGGSALTTQLAALTLKERQITGRYTNAAAPDPLGMRKPTTSEAQMRVQATGGMGADPKAIQREIDKTTMDIGKVTDPTSKTALQAYLADLQRQQGNLPAPEQQSATQTPALPPPVVPPKAPGVTMTGTVAAGSKAPVRSVDGGRTWQLDIPEKIRDPSVSYYKLIPNPVLSVLGGKTFTTRQEAERAYQIATKQPA